MFLKINNCNLNLFPTVTEKILHILNLQIEEIKSVSLMQMREPCVSYNQQVLNKNRFHHKGALQICSDQADQ